MDIEDDVGSGAIQVDNFAECCCAVLDEVTSGAVVAARDEDLLRCCTSSTNGRDSSLDGLCPCGDVEVMLIEVSKV